MDKDIETFGTTGIENGEKKKMYRTFLAFSDMPSSTPGSTLPGIPQQLRRPS